jgi:hypothetical protein
MLLRPAIVSLICTFALAGTLRAHPGHAVDVADPQSLTHYATHPDHVILWIVALASLLFLWTMLKQKTRRLAPAYARAPKHRR